ncbi:ceramidase domain-containing protein [uncultured Aquimarina sp.]|uniref:ceramidase domain-containing protein n=1 Tax=uncultured Aquimarina sp. TaxID=575652 RepID=UPI00261404CD|nr:ceramidase domain-containing protein [uncultured Aquimarina sp.]
MKKEKIGIVLLFVLGVIAVMTMFFIDPIIQNESYHLFNDNRSFVNIPNFWNVISNYPFLIVGGLGVIYFMQSKKPEISYVLLFLGIILVAIGSGYYHLFPSSQSLVWDRLPMTIVFMTLFSIVIKEFVSVRLGRLVLFPLILVGMSSILYWAFGKSGDLRFYALIQFYPMLAIPIILIFFKSKYNKGIEYWILLTSYIIAKILEYFDAEIYLFLEFISGHSLKHIVAAIGLYVLLNFYKKRNNIVKENLKRFPSSYSPVKRILSK